MHITNRLFYTTFQNLQSNILGVGGGGNAGEGGVGGGGVLGRGGFIAVDTPASQIRETNTHAHACDMMLQLLVLFILVQISIEDVQYYERLDLCTLYYYCRNVLRLTRGIIFDLRRKKIWPPNPAESR